MGPQPGEGELQEEQVMEEQEEKEEKEEEARAEAEAGTWAKGRGHVLFSIEPSRVSARDAGRPRSRRARLL